MTSKEKWNFIVTEYHQLYHEKEEVIDNRWRQYCNTLLGYQPLFGEISTQPSIHVGVHDHAIPDIVLCIGGQEVFDIELKKYSFSFNQDFETQLISYLKLQTLSVGMIVCKDIYLYSYDIISKDTKKIRITITEDNPMGIKLVELLEKESFSAEAIRKYVESEINTAGRIKELRKSITPEFIKSSVADRLRCDYSESEIDSALKNAHFSLSFGNTTTSTPIVSTPQTSLPKLNPILIDLDTFERISNIAQNWCERMTENGAITVCLKSCSKVYKRVTTEEMDKIFPVQDGMKSGWGNGHFYFYEIHIIKNISKFKMQLALSNKNAPPQIREQFNKMFKFYDSYPSKEDWEWKVPFSSDSFIYSSSSSEQEIVEALNSQFAQIKTKEAEWIEYYNRTYNV